MTKVYRYKATIPNSKIFFREYEINGDITLFRLNNFLINDLEFVPDQMFAFKGFSKDGKRQSTYGITDYGCGTVDKVTLDKLFERGEEILLFVYDIKNARFLQLTLEEEVDYLPRVSYPRVVAEKGRLPKQFSPNENIDEMILEMSQMADNYRDKSADEDSEQDLDFEDPTDEEIADIEEGLGDFEDM